MEWGFYNTLLFGTPERLPAARSFEAGPLSVELIDGGVRRLSWRSIEVIRGIKCLVRDANWATHPSLVTQELFSQTEAGFEISLRHVFDGDALICDIVFIGHANGDFSARMELRVNRDFLTNRAGFSLLHSLDGVTGSELAIFHSDGATQTARFPDRIAPKQVAFDITALEHVVHGIHVRIGFRGETFEMEDQRNWGDASFKTYCRPLALPIPYRLAAGDTVIQVIAIELRDDATKTRMSRAAPPKPVVELAQTADTVPHVAMAMDSDSIPDAPEQRCLSLIESHQIRLFIDRPSIAPRLLDVTSGLIEGGRADVDLEIVIPQDLDSEEFLQRIAEQCRRSAVPAARVLAMPELYLKSYQSVGPWPKGPTPQDACIAARRAFPTALIGGGVLTNFAELNRCLPNLDLCDYVSHGFTALVHAADDDSVVESLEGLSHILVSGCALSEGRDYRLGLLSIGMRSNPYGAAVVDNPNQIRLPMAKVDPRQRGLFAAAWAIGCMAATEGHNLSSLALSSPVGPFGIMYRRSTWPQPIYDERRTFAVYPLFHVVRALSSMAGGSRLSFRCSERNIVGVASDSGFGEHLVLANLSNRVHTLQLPKPATVRCLDKHSFEAATTDVDWLRTSAATVCSELPLAPFAVAFLNMQEVVH